MHNFPALTLSDSPSHSRRLIGAILAQEDGRRRHESRKLSAVAAAVFFADALENGGAGYLTEADADEARSWVRLEIGGMLPRMLETGTLWRAEALLRLEAEYQPGAGGYESTVRTVACSFAPRRQAGAGGHWNAAIVEAADFVGRMSREMGETPGSGEIGLIAYAYAGHLARLTTAASLVRAELVAVASRSDMAQSRVELLTTERAVMALSEEDGRIPEDERLVVLHAAQDHARDLRRDHDDLGSGLDGQIESLEVTATACLQWLRRQVLSAVAASASSDVDVSDDLADAFDDLGRAIVAVREVTTQDGRRFDRQVSRIAGAL